MFRTLKNNFMKKDLGGKELIIEIGLVMIGVFLLITFRGEIVSLLSTVFTTATSKINNLFQ